MDLATFLLVVALILFILAAANVNSPKVNLVAAGLACCAASVVLPPLV